jgi:hypothetical protein
MLQHKQEGLDAWREFTEHAQAGDFDAGEPARIRSNEQLVRAARIAGELGIADCDRALS